ncbi:hypothetical protein NM688_g1148 [Phlebia brevispora]|uniref:Uncharacterized protein n=1 Tax=Phlebia brevispora TaxID=194682 RepID=A0ACC1TCC0_9APHY|nr:hypothetical protein NM688_g1148 [Phlebia brevispora]
MSLKHILNDDPSPPLPLIAPTAQAPTTISTTDPAPAPRPPSPLSKANAPYTRRRARTRSRSSPQPQEQEHVPSRPFTYQPMAFQGAGGWDPYTGEWVQGDIFPLGPGGNYYVADRQDLPYPQHGGNAPQDDQSSVTELNGRKKRRTVAPVEDDQDYQPPGGPKRRSARRNPPRGKQDQRAQQSSTETPESEVPVEDYSREPTAEERRLVSSDLEDCPEVWEGELGNYVLETHKRQKQIDAFFNRWIITRDANTAYSVSHAYVERIARLAPPPPPPRLPPPMESEQIFHQPSPTHSMDGFEVIDYSFSHGTAPNVDAAREVEESILGIPNLNKGGKKRAAAGDASDSGSEVDVPLRTKKRKLAKSHMQDITADLEASVAGEISSMTGTIPLPIKPLPSGAKGRAKANSVKTSQIAQPPLRDTQEALGLLASASLSADASPLGSHEEIPALKKAKRIDDMGMWKRVKTLEEAQRKVWTNIARRDVVKVYRYHSQGYQARQSQLKRIATMSSLQARRPLIRTAKATKDIQAKGKRLMREMLVFWRKNEKEERDVRRREQKEALDRAKEEEERREAARQARKLEFLISQTELYSHFVGNKLKTAEVQGDEAAEEHVPKGAHLEDERPGTSLVDIDFDDEDETNIHRHARRNAQEAIALARRKAQDFDTQAALERKTNEALKLAKAQAHVRDDSGETSATSSTPLVDLDSDELNFQNPTSLTGELTIKQPQMLMATLKEYQLKGLNWLATLYEQGINGILADEMGLGKTVQSISLLAYLAETHDIWGPFLVVSPASTLHNWQQEITRFVPRLKALPYWGNVKDRATLRKFWSKKEISYNQDAPFHVLITSYQLVTQDQQYFQRVKWQYMILDEAQNIKNSSSARWKTLLGFQCRNRLLLTGTPIQNSMQELWALLHFIMPSLFDSHDEFNEWFSKDIENAAENKGSKLNEHQLRRLHMILKPFMLRRVKRHVQNELSDKIEVDIYVDLSARQRAMYKALLANVSVADLLEKAANIGDADSARSLMNLVMQFRKVCNHPELFERADVVAPFSFSLFGRPGPLSREPDFVQLPYSTRNPIEFSIPDLFYLEGGLLDIPTEDRPLRPDNGPLATLFNIWSTDWIERSLEKDRSSFSFLRFVDVSPSEAHAIHVEPLMQRRLTAMENESEFLSNLPYSSDAELVASSAMNPYRISPLSLRCFEIAEGLPSLPDIAATAWQLSPLSRRTFHWFIPPVVAPPITMTCTNRSFIEHYATVLDAPMETLSLYGLPPDLREVPSAYAEYQHRIPAVPVGGLIHSSPLDQLPPSPMHVPEAKRLIYDSGKLARLDSLLHELKAGDHKVLIYFQMTRMMDLMEEYLIYRQYKPDIFVFLLSTRAGGLGINLTAADTVIFYDHDWNPSNDAQAMDRAHRLGQTRQVTVYRLITKGTIDERIVQLARVKKDVQDIVVGNKNFTESNKPSEIVQLLLTPDQLANLDNGTTSTVKRNGKKPAGQTNVPEGPVRDLWNEEGDDFFGNSGGPANGTSGIQEVDDEGTPVPVSGRKRRGEGARRGRKPGPKPGRKKASAAASETGS